MPPNNRSHTPAQAARAAIATKRPIYEYTTLSAERPLTAAQLSDYGAQGWELVAMYVRHDAVYAVFKREVAN